MTKYCFFIVFLLACQVCMAQRAVEICGEYRYVVPANVSLEKAKQTAVERARLEAIAAEFGTVVSQTNTSTIKTGGGDTHTNFSSHGSTETKGEWLGDTRTPEVTAVYENNMFVVTAKVWGKAREIKKSDIELMAKTLRNDMESEHFKSGDRFAVQFKTPVKGYVSIFLIDDNVETAYCLLPYENADGKARFVDKNSVCEFLSTRDALYPYAENTILTTLREVDFNRVQIIFSPNEFTMPLTDRGEYVMELPTAKYSTWLRKNKIGDPDMQVIEKTVEIHKN